MNKVDELPITKEINIDKNHIDNFKLETETGTKRLKEKFHKEAVNNRNNYVNRQLNIFSKISNTTATNSLPLIERMLLYFKFS